MRNIEKSPQYDLYRLTKNLYLNKEKIVPENADMRCVKSTIINRAYYSSYSLASEWLNYNFDFQILKYEKEDTNLYLGRLKNLRTKADYHLESKIYDDEVEDALVYMKRIFNDLKFGD